jgi:ParB family chromosome partitioning protein
MSLQVLKVSECYESETNPRGTDFAGKQFDELVASIKEKGVLVPVLARLKTAGALAGMYEIIAGSRRLRAAKLAKLEEIPAQLVEMTDDEAREAQIVENLQRQDVHPLEEGEAYRQLIEDGGRTVKDVAVKVGKPEDYVRQRLFLTNLCPAAAKEYRKGEMMDGAAYLVAKLSEHDQLAALKYMGQTWRGVTVSELKKWIEKTFYHPLAFQPWVKDAAVAKIVGPCEECSPAREALFGSVKENQCTDLRCWKRKMDVYVTHRIKSAEGGLIPVVKQYGVPERKTFAGMTVLSESNFEGLPSDKKKHCEGAVQGIVVDGPDTGTTIWICAGDECSKHGEQHTDYRPSEKEKAKRKKEREKEDARRVAFDTAISEAIGKVKWPLSEKHLEALFDLMLDHSSSNSAQPLLKRHGLKADVKKTKEYRERDFRSPLRRLAEGAGQDGKLRMIFELLLPTYWTHSDDKEMKKKISKL